MGLGYSFKDGDWKRLRQIIQQIASIRMGPESKPTFAGLTLTDLTASRLTASDSAQALSSVSSLTDWIAGTANQISVADDGDGTVTLSAPQDIHTAASPTFAGLYLGGFRLRDNSDVFEISYDGARAWYFDVDGGFYGIGDIDSYNHFNKIEIDDTTIYLTAPSTIVSGTLSVAGTSTLTGNVAIGSDATINSLYPLYYATTLSPDTPGASVYVFANNLLDWSTNGNTTGSIVGHRVNLRWQPDSLSGTASNVYVTDYFLSANWGSANITNAYILRCLFNQFSLGYTGTITNLFGAYLNLDPVSGQTPVTNAYGLYIENVDASATTNYSIYTNAGTVRFGDDVQIPSDSKKLFVGAGLDAALSYDGTDGILETNLVGASDFLLKCGTEKTLRLDTVVYKDINLGGAVLAGVPGKEPGRDEFVDSTGADTGIDTYAIAVGEAIDGCFELQHDYKEGTNVVFHVHWQGIAAPTGTDYVRWELTYTVAREEVELAAAATIEIETAFDTQYEFKRSDFAAITGTNFKIGDQFLFTLERIASTGDAYAGDALIATCGLHYQIDTIGSRQIDSK